MMGGFGAHEYMAPCAAGENDVALSDSRLRRERRDRERRPRSRWTGCRSPRPSRARWRRRARRRSTRSARRSACRPGALIKAFPVIVEGRGPVLVVVRGDHRLNEIKLQNALGAPFRPAEAEEVQSEFGAEPGFIGPVGRPAEVLADEALSGSQRARGGRQRARRAPDAASSPAATSSPPGSTFAASRRATCARPAARSASSRRSRSATSSSSAPATPTRSARATSTRRARSSSSGWAPTASARPASSRPRSSSSRTSTGISWPRAVAPFDVELVTLGKQGEEARTLVGPPLRRAARRRPRRALRRPRRRAPGEKFADAELLGCPLRLTIGKKSVEAGEIEVQVRRGQEKRSLPLEGAAEAAAELWRTLP